MKTYPSLRVAYYARVAVPQRSEPDRLANQVAALRQRIVAAGVQLDPEFEFVDNGFSGATVLRPALVRLRQQVAVGALDRLYVTGLDRLTRRASHHFLLLEEFRHAGVDLILVEANSLV